MLLLVRLFLRFISVLARSVVVPTSTARSTAIITE
jgi:hypothetical protein